ncbi:hypothetical protein NKH77_41590 [Streptomyces sp. M19]
MGLTVRGAAKNGIWGSRTDRMEVRRVHAEDNGQQGMAQQRSTRASSATTSRATTRSRACSSPTASSARAVRSTPAAPRQRQPPHRQPHRRGRPARPRRAGRRQHAHRELRRRVRRRRRVPAPRGRPGRHRQRGRGEQQVLRPQRAAPFIQGTGILLTGAEDTRVAHNRVRRNTGTSPMSGGIVLYPSFVGAPNVRNTVSGNLLAGNLPVDLADRDARTGASFVQNRCQVSEPAGRCEKEAAS